MKSLKGTQTEKNLLISFAGESQARNRYTYFASVAKKEGYVQISAIFEETANQEKEHAKRLMKLLNAGYDDNSEETFKYVAGTGTVSDGVKNVNNSFFDFSSIYFIFFYLSSVV